MPTIAAGKTGSGGQRRRAPTVDIDGVVLLDKPEGLSSNAALQRVRRCFSAAKAGHTGTLDPMATGLLPICLGDATKFSQGLLEADKSYRAVARLGIATDTGDREGRVVAQAPVAVALAQVQAALAGLTGDIEQVPPMYSALKHQGQPLYAIARAGGEVARASRTVRIHRLDLVEWSPPDLTFQVTCSKGTYVRTLAEQVAAVLGTVAHLVALRRTAAGPFTLDDAVSLADLEAADIEQRMRHLRAADTLVLGLPALDLDARAALRVLQGRALDPCPRLRRGDQGVGATASAVLVRLYGPTGLPGVRPPAGVEASLERGGSVGTAFLGVGALEPGESVGRRLRPVRLVAHVAQPPAHTPGTPEPRSDESA